MIRTVYIDKKVLKNLRLVNDQKRLAREYQDCTRGYNDKENNDLIVKQDEYAYKYTQYQQNERG